MAKKKDRLCSMSANKRRPCCEVEAVVTVDERGQMVLPREVRKKAFIRPGDRLAIINMRKGTKVCCISLIKVEDLTDMVRLRLGPVLKDIL